MNPTCPVGSRNDRIGRVFSVFLASLALMKCSTAGAPFSTSQLRSRRYHDGRILQGDVTCSESCCQQYVTECPQPVGQSNVFSAIPFAVQIALIIVLLIVTAAFAGLTLGLMGLDKTGLEIIMDGDDEVNAARARRIYPLRKRGNQLLCSLVVGNVAANSLLSILLADKAGGVIGLALSTILIVIFGEIIPQAACSRYSLAIGSASVPLVRIVLVLAYPVAFPLAWILDQVMGQEIATTYSTSELMKLLQIHVLENALDAETAVAMTGALKYKNLAVKDVMTPVDRIFMLSVDDRLNYETMARIFKTGFSRIPIYEVEKNNVIGLLFVKDLIFIDPEDATRVADVIDIFGRALHVVWVDDRLGDVLRELKKGRSHMALVRDVNNTDETQDPFYELKGIITLEDIIEEIIGDEIVDETDVHENDVISGEGREDAFRWARLRLLDAKIVDQNLSYDEARAVTAHLWHNYPQVVSLLTEKQLHRLIAETPVKVLSTAAQEVGRPLPADLLYERDKMCDFATLVLTGKVTVVAGIDDFRTDVSNWCLLAKNALVEPSYKPDFSAFVSSGPCRCIFIQRSRFAAAVDASVLERRKSSNSDPGPDVLSDKPQPNQLGSPFAEERSVGRQEKLMTALRVIGRPDESDIPRGAPRFSPDVEATAGLIRRPSLLNVATVPRSSGQLGTLGPR